MWQLRVRVLCLLLLCASFASAQDQSVPEDAVFTFPTQPSVSIKVKNSASNRPLRGNLVSVGPLEVEFRERGESKHVSMDRIEHLKTNLIEFQGSDPYSAIAEKIARHYAGVEYTSGSNPKPRAVGSSKLPGAEDFVPTKPEKTTPTEKTEMKPQPSLGQGGFGGIDNLPKGTQGSGQKPMIESGGLSPDANVSETPAAKPAVLPGAGEELLCEKCQKALTAEDVKRGECPHCKTAFEVATSPSNNPFKTDGSAPGKSDSVFAPQAPAQAPAGPVAPSPTVIQGGSGFTFDSIPGWAKGGLFVILVLVGYHVMFNR